MASEVQDHVEATNKHGAAINIPRSAVEVLQTAVRGDVLIRGETEESIYTAAIQRVNEVFIQEAAFIVFVEDENDVATALKFVRDWELQVVAACGRHSYTGSSSTKGLVIDLSKLKSVSIDKEALTISAGGGCKAVDLEEPLQAQGLSVVMGAVNDTGIGGLTLGGGTGYLTGQYGMVVDNLLAVRIVLADGSILNASEKENSDLFWAIRGAGPNFGIVTQFTYRVHKQNDVFSGLLMFTPDKLDDILSLVNPLRDLVVEKGDGKLAIFLAFARKPGIPKIAPGCLIFYDGPEDKGKDLLAPLFALNPVLNTMGVKPFASITQIPPGFKSETHNDYSVSSVQLPYPLDVETIKSLIDDFEIFLENYGASVGPSKFVIELRSYAKVTSIPIPATAVANRKPTALAVIEAQFDKSVSPDEIRTHVKGMSERAAAKLAEKSPQHRSFINPNVGASGHEKLEALFGENLPRLRELKRRFDPDFVFNKWFPIAPTEA